MVADGASSEESKPRKRKAGERDTVEHAVTATNRIKCVHVTLASLIYSHATDYSGCRTHCWPPAGTSPSRPLVRCSRYVHDWVCGSVGAKRDDPMGNGGQHGGCAGGVLGYLCSSTRRVTVLAAAGSSSSLMDHHELRALGMPLSEVLTKQLRAERLWRTDSFQ